MRISYVCELHDAIETEAIVKKINEMPSPYLIPLLLYNNNFYSASL